jgi:L-threonylcarbamoyladenylate synthase
MEVLPLSSVLSDPERVMRGILEGRTFFYPTDTVYGLGCNALLPRPVSRVREAKGSGKPFSVIVPSLEWVRQNLHISFPEYLERLPGPYTFLLRKKRASLMSEAAPGPVLGIRIPAHPLTRIIQRSGVPFVTTSANVSGVSVVRSLSEIPDSMRKGIDVAIDAGPLGQAPSEVWNLSGGRPVRVR